MKVATDAEESFHLNLRKAKPAYEHEEVNFRMLEPFLQFTEKRVLDIGCGQGYVVSRLQRSNDAVGVDIIPDNPYKIKKKALDLDCQKIPFKNNSFDVIICSNLLEHITRPFFVLNQIRGLLKKGGTAIIALPNEYTLRNKVDFLLGKPLVSHQIDSFGHKYIAGIDQWTHFIVKVFPHYERLLRDQRENGIVGKLSKIAGIFFPFVGKEQVIFVVQK